MAKKFIRMWGLNFCFNKCKNTALQLGKLGCGNSSTQKSNQLHHTELVQFIIKLGAKIDALTNVKYSVFKLGKLGYGNSSSQKKKSNYTVIRKTKKLSNIDFMLAVNSR